MKENNFEVYNFNSINLIQFIIERKKLLLIITVGSIILSSLISLAIKDRYVAETTIFTAKNNFISTHILNNNIDDYLRFGDEDDVEKCLQILKSGQIMTKISDKYNLMEHYEIDKNSKYPSYKLGQKYNNNFSFKRTEFNSISIRVVDTDPQMAADMANDVVVYLDSVYFLMRYERANEGLFLLEKEYKSELNTLSALQDSLRVIQRNGINDYVSQSERFNEAYALAIKEGNTRGAKALEEKMTVLSEYGAKYISLIGMMEFSWERLNKISEKITQAKLNLEHTIPKKFIVDVASKPQKSSYPIRWLIVLGFTLSAFVFSVIVLLIYSMFEKKN